jgi:hypothetical protein
MNLDMETLWEFGAKLPQSILGQGQWWRLVTAGFLHGGLIHIAMNSWVLFDLGAQIEEVFGPSRLIVIYFCATVGGFLASTFWSRALSIGGSERQGEYDKATAQRALGGGTLGAAVGDASPSRRSAIHRGDDICSKGLRITHKRRARRGADVTTLFRQRA